MSESSNRGPLGSHLPFGETSSQTTCSGGLRPFLGLGPRMLLTTISPALLPLIFTIVHLIATRSSTQKLASTLKDKVMAACNGIANGAGSLQAIPRYLAMQTNKEVLRATRATVMAAGEVLMVCLTIIEKVIGFIIDMYRSLLLCTIQLVVHTAMAVIVGAIDLVKKGIGSISSTIQSAIQNFVEFVNGVPFVNFDIPELPSLNDLEEKLVPSSIQNSVREFNASLPTLDDFRNLTETLIAVPFDKLRKEINETRWEIASNLNDSIFPPPSLQQLGAQDSKALQKELCADLDTSIIDDTAKALYNLGTAGIVALCLVVVLGFATLACWQWMEWKAIKASVEVIESSGVRDPWTVVAIVEHPMMEQRIQPLLDRWNMKPRTRNNLRWFLSYLAHPTCLALLFMSVIGLIVIQAQTIALHVLERQARSDASSFVAASSKQLVDKLNGAYLNASREYAAGLNKALASLEDDINDRMFGPWINQTSLQLNETVVEFYADIESFLTKALNNTFLHDPMQEFLRCVLGDKVDALEKGLKWVSEHAAVNLSLVPDDVLVLSPDAMEELASPVAAAAVGAPNGDDGGALGQLIDHFESPLAAERVMYAILLGVYGGLVLIGLAIVLWHSGLQERWEHRRALRAAPQQSSFGNGSLPRGPPSTEGSFLDMDSQEKGTRAPSGSTDSLAALVAPGTTFLRLPPSPQRTPSPKPSNASLPTETRTTSFSDPEGEECVREEGVGLWVDRAGWSGFRGARLGFMRNRGVRGLPISRPAPLGPIVEAKPPPSSPTSPPRPPRPPVIQTGEPLLERKSRALPPPPRQVTPVERQDAIDEFPTPVLTVDPFSDDQAPKSLPDTPPRAL